MGVVPLYRVGDRVIYRATSRSTHPGPRALHVRPEISGEGYQYEVDKFWAVQEVRTNVLVLVTRRGKLRVVDASDPLLRRAGWWERIAYRDRFPNESSSNSWVRPDFGDPQRENPESSAFPSPRKG